MKKRILLISPQPFFQWRGSPIRIKFNILALTELGYEVDLLTLPIGEDMEIEGAKIIRVANPFSVANVPIGPSLWKVFFDFLVFIKAFSLCRKRRYSVIHGIEEAGFIGAVLAKLFSTRCIFEKHSDPFSYKQGILKNIILRVYAWVEEQSVSMADAVICTGPGLVKQVLAMGKKTPAYNIFDIPSSLSEPSPEETQRKRSELQQNTDEVLITYVGSFAVYQGVDLLFSAIPETIRQAPHARFVIIGGSDAEIAERREQLANENVAENVSFLGKIPPDILPNYLAASDIFVSPRGSGVNTPLKILDYMKAGGAIVASDHPSNRLLLDDHSAVFATANSASFAQALISLVNDADRRGLLGSQCRQIYEGSFTFLHHCQRLSECYASLEEEKLPQD